MVLKTSDFREIRIEDGWKEEGINVLVRPLLILALSTLACRPVIAIGWPEFLILVALIVFLFWPLIARIYRILEKVKKASEEDEEEKKK